MQITDRSFHVYHHVRPDTGQVFYVGKGKGRRAFDRGARRSEFWHRVVEKAGGVLIEIVAKKLTEDEAFLLEKQNIAALKNCGIREEERAKSSAALSGRIQTRIECPHCGEIGGNAMRRWHFDNCKSNGEAK